MCICKAASAGGVWVGRGQYTDHCGHTFRQRGQQRAAGCECISCVWWAQLHSRKSVTHQCKTRSAYSGCSETYFFTVEQTMSTLRLWSRAHTRAVCAKEKARPFPRKLS